MDPAETRVAVLEARGVARGANRTTGTADEKAEVLETEEQTDELAEVAESRDARDNTNWRVGELYVERPSSRSIVDNIYKGVVDSVKPGMEAAFVDIGLERNGFLHSDDIVMPDGTSGPRRGRGGGRSIDQLLKPGQEILVQVTKDALKTKGARLTMRLSISGRYLVYMPSGEGIGASKRLPDRVRERQRKRVQRIYSGPGGLIVRTAAQVASREDFDRDIAYLHKLYEVIDKRASDKAIKSPALIFQEADLSIRVLRDVLTKEFDGAVIDDPEQHHRVTAFFNRTAPELVEFVELYEGNVPLLEKEAAEEAFASVMSRRVDLPSGGYLIIDYTEALTVIDVNSGSYTGKGRGRLEDTITKVNVEAATEAVRQMRLRDIGGIIVIDFIDMSRNTNKEEVVKTLRKALAEDKSKSYVVEVSPLGLVEMTRQNITEGVREIFTKHCPTCNGDGVVESEESVAIEVMRKLRKLVKENPGPEAYLVWVHPKVARYLLESESGLHDFETVSGKQFHFEGGDALPLGSYEVIAEGTREEIEQRALPFHVGDEVLLSIEEPHMYNAGDAVARVDSYVVSVTGAGRFVGEQQLVRIEEVGRSGATGVLVDAPPAEPKSADRSGGRSGGRSESRADISSNGSSEAGSGEVEDSDSADDDGSLESRTGAKRRRGRRGGRRRSSAKENG